MCIRDRTLRDQEDEADHLNPLVDAVKGQAQTLRLLCGVCHTQITDSGHRRGDALLSHFNFLTHFFVTSPRPVPATFTANKIDERRVPFILADLRRCRRNIAYEGPSNGWPLVCAADTFQRGNARELAHQGLHLGQRENS